MEKQACSFQSQTMNSSKSLSLAQISRLADELPMPVGRKYTLNFPVTSQTILDAKELSKLFDREKFIVKITPIHETASAIENGFQVTLIMTFIVALNNLY